MQGPVSPDVATVIVTIFVALLLIYFGFGRILVLMNRDDREPMFWNIWRTVSGTGCVVLSLYGFSLLTAVANDLHFVALCGKYGLNPTAVLVTLFCLTIASTILNHFLPGRELVQSWSGRRVIKKPHVRARIVPDGT